MQLWDAVINIAHRMWLDICTKLTVSDGYIWKIVSNTRNRVCLTPG